MENNYLAINKTARDMIYIISCALHNQAPAADIMNEMDLQALYALSKSHSLVAMVAMTIDRTDKFKTADPVLQKKWIDARDKSIRKNMLLDAEREKIFKAMDEMQIWHLPLKGIILQHLYPKYGMRQMSDNDILYDVAKQEELLKYMLSQGYKASELEEGHHDAYEKPPIYNFEMHRKLFNGMYRQSWNNYYQHVKSRLHPVNKQESYEYKFTMEDFYIYITAHATKHFEEEGGTGLRTIVDYYLFLQKHSDQLDWDYIRQEVTKLEMTDTERQLRELSQALFSHIAYNNLTVALSKEQFQTLQFVLSSGTYGNISNKVQKKLGKKPSKLKYLLRRLYPEKIWWEENLPYYAKHPYLKPIYCVFRVLRGVTVRRKKLNSELSAVYKTTNK